MHDNSHLPNLSSPWPVLADDPTTITVICANIASGGSVLNLAKAWKVAVGVVMAWINTDEDRFKQYRMALDSRNEIAKEMVFEELQNIAHSKLSQVFKEDGTLKSPHEWPDEVDRFISSVEVDELFEGTGRERTQIGFTKKIKLWDKMKALEMICKKLGLFTEKIEVTGKLTLADILEKSNTTMLDKPTALDKPK